MREAWVEEALAELSPIEANGLALEFVDHQITVHPLYEYELWQRYGRQFKVLSATVRLVSHEAREIREQRIFLCDLVKASDDELKRALLRGLERGAQIVRRRSPPATSMRPRPSTSSATARSSWRCGDWPNASRQPRIRTERRPADATRTCCRAVSRARSAHGSQVQRCPSSNLLRYRHQQQAESGWHRDAQRPPSRRAWHRKVFASSG
jgi:hypothetical protein